MLLVKLQCVTILYCLESLLLYLQNLLLTVYFLKILFNYNTDIAIKQSKKSYLLSARSVLFPTNIIITSLPLSVLTSSIHFDVWWKEFASESQSVKVMQGQAFFGINNQKQQIYNHYHGHLAT